MKISRHFITVSIVIVIGLTLTYAFWPSPMMVDMSQVKHRPMMMTISEEGRTQVHDTYIVSSPVTGQLLRVVVEPGDEVIAGETIIGHMKASNPTPLDERVYTQTEADVSVAQAALQLAASDYEKAIADKQLADVELRRSQALIKTGSISESDLDKAEREALAASAAVHNATAAIAVRQAELASTQARLISFEDSQTKRRQTMTEIPIPAPASGHVLQVIQKSEVTMNAGTPILEIGNIENDLEVLVELLSSNAVQISQGERVIITGWGGSEQLNGEVKRVDPWGFTKVSALGVEEQRVNTLIRLTDPPEALSKLGHGFRVEVQIVIWEMEDALVVPSSALFREGKDWAVFVVQDGVASLQQVEIARNNGTQAQVIEGLNAGDQVVLYPSSSLNDGAKVKKREIH